MAITAMAVLTPANIDVAGVAIRVCVSTGPRRVDANWMRYAAPFTDAVPHSANQNRRAGSSRRSIRAIPPAVASTTHWHPTVPSQLTRASTIIGAPPAANQPTTRTVSAIWAVTTASPGTRHRPGGIRSDNTVTSKPGHDPTSKVHIGSGWPELADCAADARPDG
jgi:hypothetical protein